MSIKITYFVHGTTTDNEQHISSGWKDVELSKLGVEQSKKLTGLTKGLKFDGRILLRSQTRSRLRQTRVGGYT